jgi:hypothetical protein
MSRGRARLVRTRPVDSPTRFAASPHQFWDSSLSESDWRCDSSDQDANADTAPLRGRIAASARRSSRNLRHVRTGAECPVKRDVRG